MTDAEKIRTLSAVITELEYLAKAYGVDANMNRIKISLKKELRREIERIGPELSIFRAWCSLRNEHATKEKIDSLLKTIKL